MEFTLIYHSIQLNEIKKTLHLLEQYGEEKITNLTIQYAKTTEPVLFAKRDTLLYQPISVGEKWGDLFDCAWFKLSGSIDQSMDKDGLYLKLDISGEACLYDEKGHPLKGFTNTSSVFDRQYGEPKKRYYPIKDLIDSSGNIVLDVDAACNDLFGNYSDNGTILTAEIVQRNQEYITLYYDVESLIFLMESYAKESLEYKTLFEELHFIYTKVEYKETDMTDYIKQVVTTYFTKDKSSERTVYALGHAHLDLAWLWPIRETKRKAIRTITNVLYLLERYPDFMFGISQAQLFVWLEEESPYLFQKLSAYIKSGRVELQGPTWVEMDTNLVGEEAMVRQFLYGAHYFKTRFQQQPKTLWLPDVFGYSGNLPQIMKGSNVDSFLTIKLSWNLHNRFPYHTFYYEGIDGSSILAHTPPEGNYNSSASAKVIKEADANYLQRDISNDSFLLYGIGDGGGGPGVEHVERMNRNKQMPSLPNIEHKSSKEFFDILKDSKASFPTYHGELYLENHQGTYTSQSNIKYYNRYFEQKLRAVEQLMVSMNDYSYAADLHPIWEEVLLYQFHDILPGSSIKRVYDEALIRYKEMDHELDDIIARLTNDNYSNTLFEEDHIFNPLEVPSEIWLKNHDTLRHVIVAPMSDEIIIDEIATLSSITKKESYQMGEYNVVFHPDGYIKSIVHQSTNNDLLSGGGNILSVYKDTGDAWNIAEHYRLQTPVTLPFNVTDIKEHNNLYQIEGNYTFKESKIQQTIQIMKNETIIYFNHTVDWKNVGYMLRTNFKVTVESPDAYFDIQHGYLSRSRKTDTDIEKAQFEVSGHQWASVHDDTLGVALLNNGKYGYHMKNNNMDMNLLRSTNYPCEMGDIGRTSYRYAFYVHDGNLNNVDIKAKQMNAYFIPLKKSFVRTPKVLISNPNIHISTMKPAHYKDGFILRIYNNSSVKQDATLRFEEKYLVQETNLIEEKVSNEFLSLPLHLTLTPFEVKTYHVLTHQTMFPAKQIHNKTVYVSNISSLTHEEVLLIASLQGILQQQGIELYLQQTSRDKYWLDQQLSSKQSIRFLQSIDECLTVFQEYIHGMVLYSPKEESQNIAATIGSVEQYIMVTDEIMKTYCSLLPDSYINCNEIDYPWLIKHYKDDINDSFVIQQPPLYKGLYDYGMANKVLFLGDMEQEYKDEFKSLNLVHHNPILGWVPRDEVEDVTYLSKNNCSMLASNHSHNLSYFATSYKPKFQQKYVAKAPCENKHYVAFILSDGDNLQWMQNDYFFNERTYGHKKRGDIPFGWSISPSMYDVAPNVLNEYYLHQTANDLFTFGVSGIGYMYPDQFDQKALQQFTKQTNDYAKLLDVNYLAFLGTREFDNDKSALKEYAKFDQIKGGFLYSNFDYYKGYNGELWTYNDKPFLSAKYALWDIDSLSNFASMINANTVNPTSIEGYSLIVVHTWSHTYQDVLDVVEQFDDHIEVVSPQTLLESIQKNNIK